MIQESMKFVHIWRDNLGSALFLGFFFCVGMCLSQPAWSLEADQYRIWQQGLDVIQDSTQPANVFLNNEMQSFLTTKVAKHTAWQKPEACYTVAHKYMRYIRPSFFKDNLKTFLVEGLPNAAIPKKQKLLYDYKHSIFKGFAWPPLMPVAQTVKLNGVYLGTDKVDHFFASGRRYLNSYRRGLQKGLSTQDALIRALRYGVSWPEETGVLGEWSAGSFSYADLEANYQGLELARDLCEGDDAILKFSEAKGWQQQKPIRIEDYVSPLWDESFNNSVYFKSRWKKVKKNLEGEFCDKAKDPKIQKLWRDYQKSLDANPAEFHLEYLRGLIITKEIPNPTKQSLHTACGFPAGVMEGPKIWQLPKGLLEEN